MASATMTNSGNGYREGDTINLTKGAGEYNGPVITVKSIGGGGAISAWSITNNGNYNNKNRQISLKFLQSRQRHQLARFQELH